MDFPDISSESFIGKACIADYWKFSVGSKDKNIVKDNKRNKKLDNKRSSKLQVACQFIIYKFKRSLS